MNRRITVAGFTLIEVMIAVFVFFVCVFAILELVTRGLREAQSLRSSGPTAGMAAAQLVLTNQLQEGSDSGDFGDIYPEYSWTSETLIAGTNGLFQVNFVVLHGGTMDSQMSILLYRPQSVTGPGGAPPPYRGLPPIRNGR